MDTGHQGLNGLIKVASTPTEAPWFIVKETDPSGGDTVRAWVALSATRGVPPATLESALIQADRIDKWPVKKLPGDDHLQDHERLQLEYEHGRRGWDVGGGAPWRLAHLRGHMPEEPDALLRQLAAEQQQAAALWTARASEHFRDAVKPVQDRSGRSAESYAGQRRAAEDAANRAAYFLAIATALTTAADALSAPHAAGLAG